MKKNNSTYHIGESVTESSPLRGLAIFTSKFGNNPIVSIAGSFRGGSNSSSNMMIPELMTELLSEGTTKHSKKEIDDTLDALGAEIHFTCSDDRIEFSSKALTKDVPVIISLIAEQLTYPLFSVDAFEKVKKRLEGQLKQSQDSTKIRAMDAFLGTLYPKKHPHYIPDIRERLDLLKKVSQKDVVDYHHEIAVRDSMIITAAGDVSHSFFSKEIVRAFKNWKSAKKPLAFAETPIQKTFSPKHIIVPGKPNVDAILGATLPIQKTHPDYYALVAGLGILGGREGFNGRLMQIVREKMGLTYGIYAFQSGFDEGREGYWYVWGTFSPKDLKKGLGATKAEIERIIQEGVTEEELQIRKNIVRGSYAIALSTTAARAFALLQNAEDGRPVSFIDKYPSIIEKLSVDQVRSALKKHIDPKKLLIVSAGGK